MLYSHIALQETSRLLGSFLQPARSSVKSSPHLLTALLVNSIHVTSGVATCEIAFCKGNCKFFVSMNCYYSQNYVPAESWHTLRKPGRPIT